LLPAVAQEYEVGTVDDQPVAAAEGLVEDSLTKKPVTLTLSVAVRLVIETVSDVAVVGTVKAVTVGTVVSGNVMVVVADLLIDTLPAASLAHA
jgi:hypothetical protein